MTILIETDARGRTTIPGHKNKRFIAQMNADGSVLLQPAVITTAAQLEYDTNPELRALLTRAAESPTVRRARRN